MASDTEKNNNINKEISIDQCHAQANNSNKLESCVTINIEDYTTNHDSSFVNIDEFSSGNIFHNLENFTPIEINPNDNTNIEPIENEINDDVIIQDDTSAADARLFNEHVLDDETTKQTPINQSNIKQIQITNEAEASNVKYNTETTFNNDIDVETMQSLKEFEEALSNLNKTVLTDEFGTEIINLDDFNEIFDELDTVNEDLVSVKTVVENNDRETYCMENEVTDANKNEKHSNITENIDIISINSSTEDEKSQTGEIKNSNILVSDKSDSDDGYNSSDFEFISETEAHMDGFIINFRPENSEPINSYSGHYIDEENYQGEKSDPGEGPSRQNNPRNEFEDRSYRNNHQIPVGDDYLHLFQGIYNPFLPMIEIHFLENKSVRASAMNSQYDGIGFDRQLALRRHQPDSSEDEFEYEAKQSAKKILSMYPRENRKRRRRH